MSVYQTNIECVVIKLSETNLIECINKIKSVLNGQTTREEVSGWAGTYVYADARGRRR